MAQRGADLEFADYVLRGAARMVDTAAWLCDAVIPEATVRQRELSLPYRMRTLGG